MAKRRTTKKAQPKRKRRWWVNVLRVLGVLALLFIWWLITPDSTETDTADGGTPGEASSPETETTAPPPEQGDHGIIVPVEYVYDGDTIRVVIQDKHIKVRLLYIDAPEVTHVDVPDSVDECGGQDAKAWLRKRLPVGTKIDLEYDQQKWDKYDRQLGVVWLDGTMINLEAAVNGWAQPLIYRPNVRYADYIRNAWEQARLQGAGLFKLGCVE